MKKDANGTTKIKIYYIYISNSQGRGGLHLGITLVMQREGGEEFIVNDVQQVDDKSEEKGTCNLRKKLQQQKNF